MAQLFPEIYHLCAESVVLSKHFTNYGPRSDFPYYNMKILIEENTLGMR
jgi:hypothetical protein